MHTNELSLLRRICDANPRLSVHDLTPEERGALSALRREGLITQDLDGFLLPRATAASVLQAADQRAQQSDDRRAQQRSQQEASRRAERAYLDQQTKKQFRHDWRIAVFNVLAGFILGAVFDHFFDVIGYAAMLWRSLFHG